MRSLLLCSRISHWTVYLSNRVLFAIVLAFVTSADVSANALPDVGSGMSMITIIHS